MRLKNEVSEKERFLSSMCAICDEDAYIRMDGFEYSCEPSNAPLYCRCCMDNWSILPAVVRDGKLQIGDGKLQIGKEESCGK